jgi:hypothetical protein
MKSFVLIFCIIFLVGFIFAEDDVKFNPDSHFRPDQHRTWTEYVTMRDG